MNPLFRYAAVAGLLMLAAGSAAAGATVTFTQPEQFSDVPHSPWECERILKQVSKHFDVLAAKLPAGQSLKVEITDLDLAGRLLPHRLGTDELRVVGRGADWPHISLRYTITQGEQVIKSGEETLSNMSYMDRIHFNRYRDDTLRFEKEMLDNWFKEHIAAN
jgi:hypothetical protein